MSQSILNGFLIFSIVQGSIFLGLLSTKRNRMLADYVMSLWLLLFAIHSLLVLINLNTESFFIFRLLPVNLTFLYGPLLLLYAKMLYKTSKITQSTAYLHIIPFFIFFILSFIFVDNKSFQKMLSISGAASGLIYCLLTLSCVRKQEKKNLHSTAKDMSLKWLNRLLIGVIFVWVTVFVLIVTKYIFQVRINLHWYFVLIPFCISYIGYYALKQQIIFQETSLSDNKLHFQTEKKPDDTAINIDYDNSYYEKSGLLEQDMRKVFNTLEHFMKTDRLYLIPSLSLRDLANKTQIPEHHITQTLNSFSKQNFYEYVNAYRVNEFIDRLGKGDANNFSLLDIAFGCGFNSKSTFNRIFKKLTGRSPSEYKKSLS